MQEKDFSLKAADKMLWISALLAPLFSFFAPKALVVCFVLSAIFPAIIFLKNKKFEIFKNNKINILILVAFGYAFLSAFWAIDAKESISMVIRLMLLYFLFISVSYLTKSNDNVNLYMSFNILIISFNLTLFLCNVEIFSEGLISQFVYDFLNKNKEFVLTDLNRCSSFLSIAVWPCLWHLRKNKIIVVLFFAATFFTVARLESQSAVLALILGSIAFFGVIVFKKKMLNFVGLICVLAVFAVAFGTKTMNPEEAFQKLPNIEGSAAEYRLGIWSYAAEKASLKPVFGWGMNSSRSFDVKKDEYLSAGRHPLPLHPHNNVLQIWLELGFVGLCFFASFLFLVARNMVKFGENHCWTQTSFMAGLFAAYFGIGEVGFGIWQNWWVAAILICASFISANIKNTTLKTQHMV